MSEPISSILSRIVLDGADAFINISLLLSLLVMALGAIGAVITSRSQKEISSIDLQDDSREENPFEREVLAKYYNQALMAANVSFWFSLIFAAVGFGVILISFATYSSSDPAGTIIKVLSGVIIDAVAGLFFVQSNNARKSMAEFFEKLRLDRLSAEAREMIKEIENVAARDELRMQLVMKFSGIEKLIVSDRPSH